MDHQRITELTIKFIHQDISPKELAELNGWLDLSAYNRQRFEERVKVENILLNHARWQETLEELNEFSTPTATLPLDNQPLAPARLRPLSGQRWVWSVAAAAMLVCVLGAALWRGTNKRTKPQRVFAAAPSQDLPPVGHRAVLTLANGQKVILDSVAKGRVAVQGSNYVAKLADGQLAYQKGAASGETGYNAIFTPRGNQFQVSLPDGSKVWLDAGSSIRFQTGWTSGAREVELTGQAYFEVKHSITMPFRVRARGQVIEDIGTHFNVSAYEDETEVTTTLFQGAVKTDGLLLATPGEQAAVSFSSGKARVVKNADMEAVLGWKNGMLIFDRAPLSTVLRALSRWYNVDVVYESGKDSVNVFSGQLSRDVNVSMNLKILAETGYNLKVFGQTIEVLSEGK